LVFGIKRYHFAPVGKEPLDRPKPFSHVRLWRADEPELGGGALCGARRGDFGRKRRGHGRGFELPCQWSGKRSARDWEYEQEQEDESVLLAERGLF
jgi:hypothetical protein